MTRRHAKEAAHGGGDSDGVVFVRVASAAASDSVKKGQAIATIAVYAGMTAAELQGVVRAALALPALVTCVGFVVAYGATVPNGGAWKERIVPLTVACVSPEVLQSATGFTRVVVASAPSARGVTSSGTAALSLPSGEASQRLQRLVAALRDDDPSLSRFEAAVLSEICEQHLDDVLRVVQDATRSLASKKQFLLSLVRGGSSSNSSSADVGHEQRASRGGLVDAPHANGTSASVERICKKVVAIAHTVFSPHVQSDLQTEASLYREKQLKLAREISDASAGRIVELLEMVEKLLNKHALQEEQTVPLTRWILGENRLLLSALASYKLDYNLGELERTLVRMAALGKTVPTVADIPANASPKKRRHGSPRKHSSPRRKAAAETGDDWSKTYTGLPHDLLTTLHQRKMVTTLELDLLRALVDQHDAQVLAAVDTFETTRDGQALRDQLVAIVEEITFELGDEEKVNDGGGEVSLDHWQARLVDLIQHWFSQGRLTADYVHALQALIHDSHNLLQSAFEVFASDGDESELLDTLQRIAKLQLQANEGVLVPAFARIVDDHCDVLRVNEKTLVKQLFARKNELARAAWEVFEVEQNVEDFGDTLLRIARFTTRQDAKLRLVEVVGEMMQRSLIQSHEVDGLIRLYEEKNEAIVAASEAFESDSDVKELVETLLLIVKHANFGDAPQCSSPRHGKVPPPATRTPPSSPVPEVVTSSSQFEIDSEAYFAARLIEILGSKGRLAKWQNDLLLGLLAKEDDRVFAIIDVYNEDRDARELVDTLWRLCDLTAWAQNKGQIVTQYIRPLEQNGLVTPRGVLQKLVEARDDRLIAAFVVFLGDGNSEEFADTLVRLARLEGLKAGVASSEGQQEAANKATTDQEDEEEKQDFRVILARLANDRDTSGLSHDEIAAIEAYVLDQEPVTLAAFDVYRATLDRDDFVDTLQRLIASRRLPSRTVVMEKQLLHFVSELQGVQPEQVAALKQSIARRDSIVEAAVEVYEKEHDEEDLKDTLKRIAIHLASSEEA